MKEFDFQPRTRVIFGAGAIAKLGSLARELNFGRTLLVADHGLVDAGHVGTAVRQLEQAGIEVVHFHDFGPNPDTAMVQRGRDAVAATGFTSVVALGGGSSMDMAKALNIVCHSPGRIQDYHGHGKVPSELAPMIGIPTTAGTGSEAQSYAIISNAETHVKMAIGDPQIAFRAAILDPELTVSQPPLITATGGYDAISHAVETCVSTKRTPISESFSREAWRLLSANFETVLSRPEAVEARAAMLLGAHYAGAAIENSMLGAAHACANPLTARFGVVHGAAIALTLPRVVKWNQSVVGDRYRELFAGDLAARLAELAEAGGLPPSLSSCGIVREDIASLADAAIEQWTGRFNPRPFNRDAALEIYECAF